MSHGAGWSDFAVFDRSLPHADFAVLGRWADGIHRDDSYRQLVADLHMARHDVLSSIRRLIERQLIQVKTGGPWANSRRITAIDPRYDRRAATNFVFFPEGLFRAAVASGNAYTPLRLRYLALLNIDQIKRGMAYVSTTEAATLLGATEKAIRGANTALRDAGEVEVYGRHRNQPIYAIPNAHVKPDPERFIPAPFITEPLGGESSSYITPEMASELAHKPTPEEQTAFDAELTAFLAELDAREGLEGDSAVSGTRVCRLGNHTLPSGEPHSAVSGYQSTTYDLDDMDNTGRFAAEEIEERQEDTPDVDLDPLDSLGKDQLVMRDEEDEEVPEPPTATQVAMQTEAEEMAAKLERGEITKGEYSRWLRERTPF